VGHRADEVASRDNLVWRMEHSVVVAKGRAGQDKGSGSGSGSGRARWWDPRRFALQPGQFPTKLQRVGQSALVKQSKSGEGEASRRGARRVDRMRGLG
jgi:hypothetical protein